MMISKMNKTAAGAIELVKIKGSIMEREDRFMILFRGKKWGELYFNMRGYVAEKGIPVPSSDGSGRAVGLGIGEKGLSAFKREISRANREWASLSKTAGDSVKKEMIMSEDKIAEALIQVAESLVGQSRTAAVKDLKELRAILPEVRKKQKEQAELARRQIEENNRILYEATKDLDRGTKDILSAIQDALVKYFDGEGIGIRRSGNSGGLVEVFLGSKDGVERRECKVSVHIALYSERAETASYMIRNDDLDTIEGTLSNTNTVAKLIAEVKKAHKRGHFDVGV
jgi:hypothetical protein